MRRPPPRTTSTYTLFPYTTLFRSAVDHCDRGLAEMLQGTPLPGLSRLADAPDLRGRQAIGLAKIFLQIHPGRKRVPRTCQDHHAAAGIEFELLQHGQHLAIQRRTHRLALFGALERHT